MKTRVKPAPGRRVRDPETGRPLAAVGQAVDLTTPYWRRRLDQGDIVLAGKAKPPKPAAPQSKESEA